MLWFWHLNTDMLKQPSLSATVSSTPRKSWHFFLLGSSLGLITFHCLFFPQWNPGDSSSPDSHDQRGWRSSCCCLCQSLSLQGRPFFSSFLSLRSSLPSGCNWTLFCNVGGHGGGPSFEREPEQELFWPAHHLPADKLWKCPEASGRAEGGGAGVPDPVLSCHQLDPTVHRLQSCRGFHSQTLTYQLKISLMRNKLIIVTFPPPAFSHFSQRWWSDARR